MIMPRLIFEFFFLSIKRKEGEDFFSASVFVCYIGMKCQFYFMK